MKEHVIESRNLPTLLEFVRYCTEHPEERFWQALRNWSGYYKIQAYEDPVTLKFKDPGSGIIFEAGKDVVTSHDSFYFEGRRHDGHITERDSVDKEF